jgi:glycosyltransferase involved in cell wall biosynthesis
VSGTPVASVVVPAYNRAHLLPQLVRALEAQRGVDGFEAIIIDNGSVDDTSAVLHELAEKSTIPITVLRMEENKGPCPARNLGWRAAKAPIVAFTDDDCVPEEGWLAALLVHIENADLVQGRTEPDPTDPRPIGPFGRTVIIREEAGHYETCNLAYRKTLLEQLDGFDEDFHRLPGGPVTWGDDTDLGWRARESGARTTFATDAVVYHELRPSSFRRHLTEITRHDGIVLSLRRHPQMREVYYRRYFFNAAHPPALLAAGALVALAARPRSPLRWAMAAAAGANYTRACMATRHHPPQRRTWLKDLPLSFIADLFEIGVFTRASIRYRTPFF